MHADRLTLSRDGAERLDGAASPVLADLRDVAERLPGIRAGTRLHGADRLRPHLASTGAIGRIARRLLGPAARPVRAILFDKTARANWSLGWHQDRTICVQQRRETAGFGPWTIKRGMVHVAPPDDLLALMVTMRIHLDDVPAANAPLLVAPGSHREGRIAEPAIDGVVQRCGIAVCLAEAGDVWVYAAPILHASKASVAPARRRVLQVDYAAEDLPGGLIWRGV